MKNKIILLSALLLAAIVFAGCGSNKTFKSSQETLKLIGNPTTGFTWVVSNSNPEIVDVSEDIQKPEGFYDSAWNSIFPFVKELALGGGNFYDGWMKNPKSAMISCNDGFRPVSFLLEVME